MSLLFDTKAQEDAHANAPLETRFSVLRAYWASNCKEITTWWLNLSDERRKEILLTISPDMPETSTYQREKDFNEAYQKALEKNLEGFAQNLNPLTPSDYLLPEFNQESLLSLQGKIFSLFLTRRLTSLDSCLYDDISHCNKLFLRNRLPLFHLTSLSTMDSPFINPRDPQLEVFQLHSETSQTLRDEINLKLEYSRLFYDSENKKGLENFLELYKEKKLEEKYGKLEIIFHAEIYLIALFRRNIICVIIETFMEKYEEENLKKDKNSHASYLSLLTSEIHQEQATNEMAKKRQEELLKRVDEELEKNKEKN